MSIMFLLLFLFIYPPFKWPIQILHQICRNTDTRNYLESVGLLTFDHHTCSQPWIKLLKERGDGKIKQARENENIKDRRRIYWTYNIFRDSIKHQNLFINSPRKWQTTENNTEASSATKHGKEGRSWTWAAEVLCSLLSWCLPAVSSLKL